LFRLIEKSDFVRTIKKVLALAGVFVVVSWAFMSTARAAAG
jgi:hypothetical protein